jgi:hypothetical protein
MLIVWMSGGVHGAGNGLQLEQLLPGSGRALIL